MPIRRVVTCHTRTLRVVYYTHTAFFDAAMSLVKELAARLEVHVLLEVGPDAWQTSGFETQRLNLQQGLVSGDEALAGRYPSAVREIWQSAASFQLVVHNERRSLHPSTWQISGDVLRYVHGLKPDVLHVEDVDVSLRLAPSLRFLKGVPLVLTVHDPHPHKGERDWRKVLARKLVFGRVNHFVMYNERQAPAFAGRYGIERDRISALTLGPYDLLRAWSRPEVQRNDTVLFFGRLAPYKGLDVLFDAAQEIAKAVPGVCFVVAGRPVPGYVPPAAPSLGSRGTVEMIVRYIDNENLARLFGQATFIVCPYVDATQSGVVMTAYAFGRAVIATDVGGLTDYVADEVTGLVVPAGNPSALASAVVRLLRNRDLRKSLEGNAASVDRSGLCWTCTAERLLEVYHVVTTSA